MHNFSAYNENSTFQYDGTTGCDFNLNNMSIKEIDSMYTSTVIFCVINSLTGVIAVFCNALVIMAIVKTESLHNPSNIALCCLAVTDFITGFVTQPCVVISRALTITGHYSWSCTFYECSAIIGLIMTGTSFLTISVITMDRFLALHLHLRYPQFITIPRVLVVEFVGLTWTIIIGIVRIINANVSTIFFATTLFIVIIFVTIATIATLRTVRNFERKVISEAQLAARLENRAVDVKKIKKNSWTLVAIFCTLFLSYILYLSIILAVSNFNVARKYQRMAIEAAITILLTNASVNPAVYCLRMKEIRQAVWKIIKNNGQVLPL